MVFLQQCVCGAIPDDYGLAKIISQAIVISSGSVLFYVGNGQGTIIERVNVEEKQTKQSRIHAQQCTNTFILLFIILCLSFLFFKETFMIQFIF